ncbi:MAG: divalent-cation tolerance protein CutA, partial [Candidatus Omnitrophica bacterium]|nr:divalent-cation tolerance protein CutA [Candidatus Omnitrophota bacterium]
MRDPVIIFVTAPSKKEAERVVLGLIKKGLAACGNIVRGVDSIFLWKGKLERSKEVLIILKTKKSLFDKVAAEIKKMHSYEVPEIICLPVIEG